MTDVTLKLRSLLDARLLDFFLSISHSIDGFRQNNSHDF